VEALAEPEDDAKDSQKLTGKEHFSAFTDLEIFDAGAAGAPAFCAITSLRPRLSRRLKNCFCQWPLPGKSFPSRNGRRCASRQEGIRHEQEIQEKAFLLLLLASWRSHNES